jgi:hypothetical protein
MNKRVNPPCVYVLQLFRRSGEQRLRVGAEIGDV